MPFDSKSFLKTASARPGVYRMYSNTGEVLYVGKALNLKKRLSNYFQKKHPDPKTESLVKQIADIQVTLTSSENEALIVENNLIKLHLPRYNVLMRDDKSYPYLFFSTESDFPRLMLFRGAKTQKGRYFGPYPNSYVARQALHLLQKLFKIRSCEDGFFSHRTRPCLQYQIHRCTAPCVAYIAPAQYQEDVRHALMFLEGKNAAVIDELVVKMEQASHSHQFEQAAFYRDQISQLRQVQKDLTIHDFAKDVDVIAVVAASGVVCVQMLSIRNGLWLGNNAYFPKVPANISVEEVLAEFLPQYYLAPNHLHNIPDHIIVSHDFPDRAWVASALSAGLEKNIQIKTRVPKKAARWQELVLQNATQALRQHLSQQGTVRMRMRALQAALHLDASPGRIECFDVSHTQGEATVASCVVFDEEGSQRRDYRRFNISDITPGDDYAALTQVLTRRYSRLQVEGKMPDIIMIDGGKGQLTQAENVLATLGITGIILLSIAKGPGRKPGLDVIYRSPHAEQVPLTAESLALHLLQQIRDEAHRFAITAHRQRRQKNQRQSMLEGIPGIGASRRRELLRQFGGLQEIKGASVDDLAKVKGISKGLAVKIFNALHGEM